MIPLSFPAEPIEVWPEPPCEQPEARLDADPDVSAEIAVERGIATGDERAWAEWLREGPLLFPSDDTVEVETSGDFGEPVAYFADGQLLANEDGTFTTAETTTDPREDR